MEKKEYNKDTSILILRILKEHSRADSKMTKKQIIEELNWDYGILIEEKQFYRVIDKLIESNEPIMKTSGVKSYYWYDDGLSSSMFSYLFNMVYGSSELSALDKEKIVTTIANRFDKSFDKEVLNLKNDYVKTDSLPYNPFEEFEKIYAAYKDNRIILYKTYINNKISDIKHGMVKKIYSKDQKTHVVIDDEDYLLEQILVKK